MANIFKYRDYKVFIKEFINEMPKKGRGQYKLLGEYLNVGPVVISQIFNGTKELTNDHGLLITKYYGLSELETDYFLLMISYARSTHYELKNHYETKLKEMQKQALDLKSHITQLSEFNDEAKQTFYSDWKYSAIRLSCALPEIKTEYDLTDKFKLPLGEIKGKLNFLKKYDLVIIEEGSLSLGKGSTFLSKDSPLLNTHRKNWRVKGFEEMQNEENLFYVGPMCLSKEIAKNLRAKLLTIIQETLAKIPKQDAEECVCLNIDLFKV